MSVPRNSKKTYNRLLKLTFAELSSTGPVRHHNEDSIGFWQPDNEEDRLIVGSSLRSPTESAD